MDKTITVVVAEDHYFIRKGIRALLDITGDIQVIGEAGNGLEAVELVEEEKPDVLILDISMPRMNGIEVIERLHQSDSRTRILIHTVEDDPVYLRSLYDLGVAGILLKGCNPETLIYAVQTVAGGGNLEHRPGCSKGDKVVSPA